MPPALLRLWAAIAPSLLGGVLLSYLGGRYRIDLVRCPQWPPFAWNICAAALYLVALSLWTTTWLLVQRQCQGGASPRMHSVLWAGALVHVVASLGPPSLSDDPLFYAALGRAGAEYGADPYAPLCQSLPPGDAWLAILPWHWRCGTSAYAPGFHLIARAFATVAGRDLALHLRLHQAGAAAALLGAAAFTGQSMRASSRADGGAADAAAAQGAAFVVLNPLAIVEGAGNGHNDAYLALCAATFVWAYVSRRSWALWGALLAGVTIKASALLLAGMYALAQCVRALRGSAVLRRAVGALLALSGIGLAAALLLPLNGPAAWTHALVPAFLRPSTVPWELCTRSIECIPRTILHHLLHRPGWAAAVGGAFRGIAALWLFYASWRASRHPRLLLSWLAAGLLVYFLYLHAWSQSWYLLSLLPLIPWAQARFQPALRVVCVSAAAYYAFVFIGNCFSDDLAIALFDLLEGLCVVVPPSVLLWRVVRPGSAPL